MAIPIRRTVPTIAWMNNMPTIDIDKFKASIEQTTEDRVWVGVDVFDICIIRTDEGIVVNIYPYEEGVTHEGPIATTYAVADEAANPT